MATNDQDYTSGIKTGAELKLKVDEGFPFMSFLIEKLERIARAQEGMLAIAAEAREERLKLSNQLKEKLKQPFEGK